MADRFPLPPSQVPPRKKRISNQTGAVIALGVVSAFLLVSTLGLGGVVANGHMIQRIPGPTVTRTVTKTIDMPTGVDQSTYDGCQQAYHQSMALLKQQTTIVERVANAASAALTAVNDGDVTALDAAGAEVSSLSDEEGSMQSQVEQIDPSACQ